MTGTRTNKRPDQSGKPGYITKKGYLRLSTEASYLWNEKRPEIIEALAAAAAEGDRSENAEYIYRKKQLAELDRRLRFLSKRLEVLKVVEGPPKDDSKVYFSCWVEVEDNNGTLTWYRIVGPDEWDAKQNEISMASPMAKALLGKKIGDEVLVRRPKGELYLTITSISITQPKHDSE